MHKTILIINPGSTSTKVAIWDQNRVVLQETVCHPADELAKFPLVIDQFALRLKEIKTIIADWLDNGKLTAVVGRGGPLRPLEGGTYEINSDMLDDLRSAKYSNHASNLGAIIAHAIANEMNLPCFVVDPVTVDEFTPLARISGLPGIERKCRSHALNIKAVARQTAEQIGKPLSETNFVVSHMGGGLSICALGGGKIIDVNDGLLGMGPFSPERSGALPIGALVELCYSKRYTKNELLHRLSKDAGLSGYLGTADLLEIENRIKAGNQDAALYFNAMTYQIAKEIGSMSTVLGDHIDAILLTGGMANSKRLTDAISKAVSYLAPVKILAGEKEMEALALGALRVLEKKEEVKIY